MAVTHDAVVIGGGPAGLAAATWLARYRRDVVVVDSQDYRASSVVDSHGYLARDPQDPMQFLQTAREQLIGYRTASYHRGAVARVVAGADRFELECSDGTSLAALRVVLATGVVDACPDLAAFEVHYGASAFHCPACDGYDAEGRDVVAYGWDVRLVGFATSLLNWASSVTVLTDGRRFEGDDVCRDLLLGHGVRIDETPAVRMLGTRGDLRGVELQDGRVVPASLLFFSVAHAPRNDLARALGCALDDEGYIQIDEQGETSVTGVYAAGDATPGLQLVQVAAAQGAVAGVAAALSLQGEPGSPLSPPPAPDTPAEIDQATTHG
ncbi:MAG TPA: NAD(P)/FAD-dependent oxidoreductase [Mycobacteriales bacterium]|nr:NAD(P)/FAD-dependent oxidoreductase [Mycobacteriales bacterium]